jgi:hypothetical protein
MNYIATTEGTDGSEKTLRVDLPEGTSMRLHMGMCIDFRYDINGQKKSPNVPGRDQFSFMLCPAGGADKGYGTGSGNPAFVTYRYVSWPSRSAALNECKKGTVQSGGNWACSVLLQFDGWEFSSDYPYKL